LYRDLLPVLALLDATLGKLKLGKRANAVLVLCAATAIALPAQTFTSLFSFDGTDGSVPWAALVQATNGDLYGTTAGGGNSDSACPSFLAPGCGTIFKITPSGTLTTVYTFCSQSACPDGANPEAALVQATNGDFYGTTVVGGANGGGTVFKITPSGTLTTLYSFCAQSGCADGGNPYAGLVQATNGDFYGTTELGGANTAPYGGAGTVFKITPGGTLTTLYSFCSQGVYPDCTDGLNPLAPLVQATNGDLYGTTCCGGASDNGTVFKITPSGTLTTLHTFAGYPTDGSFPTAALIQATNGDLYGTVNSGGANCAPGGCGTVFKITPGGTLTTLHSFDETDGDNPEPGLVQATNGNFYGTVSYGGTGNWGTLFEITPNGTFTTLYTFCPLRSPCPDGEVPNGGLVQATNGTLYGTASGGGTSNDGVVFSLSVGLGPFVETQTTSGKVGEIVKILGTDLTGATSVSFNGTAAAFTVVSPSLITARVPAGATTGTVQVVTPSGTLSSNVPFRVLP
jgi:uncharacterized repeat protein (TIGR03803 family)